MALRLITVKEIAKLLTVSPSVIYKLVQQEKIPYYKIEGKILFSEMQIMLWLEKKNNTKGLN
jgi:excisionase family DNA binding protein